MATKYIKKLADKPLHHQKYENLQIDLGAYHLLFKQYFLKYYITKIV